MQVATRSLRERASDETVSRSREETFLAAVAPLRPGLLFAPRADQDVGLRLCLFLLYKAAVNLLRTGEVSAGKGAGEKREERRRRKVKTADLC